jgi:hypothetical protein
MKPQGQFQSNKDGFFMMIGDEIYKIHSFDQHKFKNVHSGTPITGEIQKYPKVLQEQYGFQGLVYPGTVRCIL